MSSIRYKRFSCPSHVFTNFSTVYIEKNMLFVTVPVSFQPVIHITSNEYENRENQQSARVVNFVKGKVKMKTNDLIQYL